MKKSSLLLMCASMFLAGKSVAQTTSPCGTDEMRQIHILQHPEILQYEADLEAQIQARLKHVNLSQFSRTTTTDQSGNVNFWYDIPVVVHVIHDYNTAVLGGGGSDDFISDDDIFNSVVSWNKVYACQNTSDTAQVIAPFKKYVGNAKIRLHLATVDPQGMPTKGITRRRSYQTYNGNDQAKYDDWDPASYVNIWVINTMNQSNKDAAAYATPPSSGAAAPYRDGIITLFGYIDYDNTINHEMGHMFNLAHPWGNNNSAQAAGVNCSAGGSDNVDDTPPTLGHYPDGCRYTAFTSGDGSNPVFYPQGNIYDTICATNYFKIYARSVADAATGSAAGTVDSFVNYPDTVNAQNIMDYTYCSKNFTKGQVARMHAALNSTIAHRNNLWDTTNLIRTGVMTSSYAFIPRPDLPPIPEFSVTSNAAQSSVGNKNQQYFAKPGSNLIFRNRTWNDTVTRLVWTFTNGAAISTKTDSTVTLLAASNVTNNFSVPGWASVTMAATGNHTSTVTKTWNNAIFVADAVATPGAGYYQEFDPAGDVAKWPTFNIFDNEFHWEASSAGMFDNHSMKYTGFDNRLNFSTGLYPNVGSPLGDFDDMFSVPLNLSSFSGATCNLNFFTSGASRSSNSLDITDTFEVAYSTDGVVWVKLSTLAKGNLANKGAISTPYTPSAMSDWLGHTVTLPTGAKSSYVLFRFRYRPGVDHSFFDYSTGNNFYIDRIHISSWPVEVSGVMQSNSSITVAPNPTSNNAYVIIKDADNTTAHVVVSDIAGKVVYTTTQVVSGNEASIEIPASAITAKGVYLVQTSTGKQAITQKLVVY